jgi:5-methylcytosine-specific restriction enzyme subunit McrC
MLLFEFGNYHTLPADIDLNNFKAYLREVWNSRHLFYTGTGKDDVLTEEQEMDLQRQGQALLRFDGNDVQARNYAGFIQYKHLHLPILPKIFSAKQFSANTVFEHLLYYLSYGRSFRFPFSWNGLTTGNQDDLLQLLIHWFAGYTEKILTEKPYRAYYEEHGTSGFMQGKLDVPGYVRHTLSSGQWQELYTRHAPFVYDNDFNRLVKYTARQLLPLAGDHSRILLQSLLQVLQEVSERHFSHTDCESIAINRLQEEQLNILQMCRFFLASQQLKVPHDQGEYFSFLVPMERVFEEFVAGFIQSHFPGLQFEVQSVHELASSDGKRVAGIKNDIWLPGRSVIIDTKYKCIGTGPHTTMSQIGHSDIYQMVAYAVRRKCTEVHLVYPQTTDAADFCFEVTDSLAGKTINMHVHLIPVIVSEESLLQGNSVAAILMPLLQKKFAGIFKTESQAG